MDHYCVLTILKYYEVFLQRDLFPVFTDAELEELLDRSDLISGGDAPAAGTNGTVYEVI